MFVERHSLLSLLRSPPSRRRRWRGRHAKEYKIIAVKNKVHFTVHLARINKSKNTNRISHVHTPHHIINTAWNSAGRGSKMPQKQTPHRRTYVESSRVWIWDDVYPSHHNIHPITTRRTTDEENGTATTLRVKLQLMAMGLTRWLPNDWLAGCLTGWQTDRLTTGGRFQCHTTRSRVYGVEIGPRTIRHASNGIRKLIVGHQFSLLFFSPVFFARAVYALAFMRCGRFN